MAHLSARHGDAKRRREELSQERALAIAAKAGYPFDFHAKRAPATGVSRAVAEPPPLVENADAKRFTADELAEAARRCEARVHSAREKEAHVRRLQAQQELERLERSERAGHEAPALAAKRLREHKQRARLAQERTIDALVTQQPSAIEAMNVARMLSPRFEERVAFAPVVARRSADDERVKHLLANARVGSYYQ